jgi:hypothetical protein
MEKIEAGAPCQTVKTAQYFVEFAYAFKRPRLVPNAPDQPRKR